MKHLLSIFLVTFTIVACHSQNSSESVTVGDLFTELIGINYSEEAKLTYKKFKYFNFSDFSPVEGVIDSLDYFEVGYNKKGSILEVIRHSKKHKLLNYKFKVYDKGKFKILILKEFDNGKFFFTSLAFISIRNINEYENYMIDVAPRFGPEKSALAFSYEKFPITKLENISAIALLNKDLYPERELKILNSRILMLSDYIYKRDDPRTIDAEIIDFFFTPDKYPALRITSYTSFVKIFPEENISEYQLSIKPDMHDLYTEPLWVLKGYYLYTK
jgi:hypothetical protein